MRYHELKHHHEEDFIQRHIGPAAHDIEAMLKIIGFDSLDRMTDAILPKSIHMSKALEVCPPASEDSLLHIMKKFAGQNRVLKSLIGQGYYGTITPPVCSVIFGKSGMVYRPHTLSAGNQPGAAGSLAQFPNHDLRFDRL